MTRLETVHPAHQTGKLEAAISGMLKPKVVNRMPPDAARFFSTYHCACH